MSSRNTARTVWAIALILIGAGVPARLGAQQPAAPTMPAHCRSNCVAIRSTGGFLGYLDGFPEFPGWPGETFEGNPDLIPNAAALPLGRPAPYGGLLGAAAYLKSHPVDPGAADTAVLLISGNNHPQQIAALRDPSLRNKANGESPAASHWFWKPMIDMKPQAIGVGTEDMHRWLAEMRPESLVTWIKNGIAAGLPFVASNVIVRMTGHDLNVVHNDEHGLTLEIAESESLDMLDSLTINHSCDVRDAVRSSTFTFDSGPVVTVHQLTPAEALAEKSSSAKDRRAVLGNVCKTALKFSERLRPGKSYLLRSSLTGPAFRFKLTTHDVLTPHPETDGLPIVAVTRGSVPMAIMAFLSPTTANSVPPEEFGWTSAQGCRAAKCRIEFLPAGDAARSLLEAMTPAAGTPMPVLAVISDLDERETTSLLDAVPEIRFLALQPSSGRLGSAALPAVPESPSEPRYSGDRSFGAVVDAGHPDLARIMVRPTSLGENVHTAFADFSPPARGRAWEATNISLWVQPVPGAGLGWKSSAGGVQYTAALDPARFRSGGVPVAADPTVFRPYCPIDAGGPFDAASHERQGDLWTNPASVTGLVADDARRSLQADIALVPASWIDPDVIAAIADPPAGGAPPLSGFMLQRILYRAQRVVRVSIAGSDLAAALGKIIAAAAIDGDGVCASGLGLATKCPLKAIDADALLVNLRKPESANFYRVVLPASLALAQGFVFAETDTHDLLPDLDARLSACLTTSTRALRPAADPVAERLEIQLAERPQHFVRFDPLTFEFASTRVAAPSESSSVFSRLPVDGSGEQPSRRIAIETEMNAALWDTPRFAVRIPAELRYGQTRVNRETSYDRDEFSVGLRVDRRGLPVRWAQLFAGIFWDGRIVYRNDSVAVTPGGATLPFTTSPQRNLAGAVGVEVAERHFGPVSVTGLQLSAYRGRVYNLPVAVRLGDRTIGLSEFLDGHLDHSGEIADGTPFGYITATESQSRVQVDAKTATRLPIRLLTSATLSTEHRYRWYYHDAAAAGLFTSRSGDSKVSLDLGIGSRWSIGPYAERIDMTVAITGGSRFHFGVFRWGVQLKMPLFWNGRSIQ